MSHYELPNSVSHSPSLLPLGLNLEDGEGEWQGKEMERGKGRGGRGGGCYRTLPSAVFFNWGSVEPSFR